MPRMDSGIARGAGQGSTWSVFEEAPDLVHVLVEEREHGDRAIEPVLEVLIHQIGVRVSRFGFVSISLATKGTSAKQVPHQSSVMTRTRRVAPSRSSTRASSGSIV